jgi:UDP-N-acetylmuramoyl-tripeptide--D-alanyl-D-alanine ligase
MGKTQVDLPAPGLHNVMNALAATCAALAMGVDLSAITAGLQQYAGIKGRLQSLPGLHNAQVIDDTYNANPISMRAAIDVLKAKPGKKLLVLGDIGELGPDAPALHAEIGQYAKAAGIDALFTLGTHSERMSQAFGAAAQHYPNVETLAADLLKAMQAGSTVLVKGSRFMAMERVVKEIVAKEIAAEKNREAH